MTAGGIVGRVLDITDDRVTLETSVGASFVVLRPYVLRKLEPVEPPSDVVDGTPTTSHEPRAAVGAEPDVATTRRRRRRRRTPRRSDGPRTPEAAPDRRPRPPTIRTTHDASGADGPPII